MAIARRWLAAHFNKPGYPLFDYDVYAIGGDGCMMEGVSQRGRVARRSPRARPSCAGSTTTTTSRSKATPSSRSPTTSRRSSSAYGWNVTRVGDANDLEMLKRAFATFQATTDRPTLIIVDSHIGWGSHKQDTHSVHGAPLGEDEIKYVKKQYGWPDDAKFLVPDGVYDNFKDHLGARAQKAHAAWTAMFDDVQERVPAARRASKRGCRSASCPRAGTRTCRCSPPIRRASPAAQSSAQGAERAREEHPVADRRLGRPRAVDADPPHVRRRRRLRDARRRAAATSTSAFASTRWPRR